MYSLGQRQNPSWCFAVRITREKPKSLATWTHWVALRLVGLKTDGRVCPEPSSDPVKVLGPKWRSMAVDPSCHWSWCDDGMGIIGRGFGFSGLELDRETSDKKKKKKRRVRRDIFCFSRFDLSRHLQW